MGNVANDHGFNSVVQYTYNKHFVIFIKGRPNGYPVNEMCYVGSFHDSWLEHLANVPAKKCTSSNCVLYIKNLIFIRSN